MIMLSSLKISSHVYTRNFDLPPIQIIWNFITCLFIDCKLYKFLGALY